jgi:hypothetical protein
MLAGDGAMADARSRLTAVHWAAAEWLRHASSFEPFAEVEPPQNSGRRDPRNWGGVAATMQILTALTDLLATQLLPPVGDGIVGAMGSYAASGERERAAPQ